MAARPPVIEVKPKVSNPTAKDKTSAQFVAANGNAASVTDKPSGWTPPQGDPLPRYQAGKTPEERAEIMGSFMALGHDQNPLMLIEALKDSSTSNRISAIEYAAQLPDKQAAEVLKEAILNDQSDVREMAWSILAPHPLENKAPAFMATIERGSDTVLEESFKEMGRTPEMPLFEAMLTSANRVQGTRQSRVFKELQQWLKPGGGEVPAFKSVADMTAWWTANKQRYDQYLLRVDQ